MSVPKVQEVYDNEQDELEGEEPDEVEEQDGETETKPAKSNQVAVRTPFSFANMFSGLYQNFRYGWTHASRMLWSASFSTVVFFIPFVYGLSILTSLKEQNQPESPDVFD